MRKSVLLALVLFAAPSVGHAEEEPIVDRAAVVAACAQETVLPQGVQADEAAITAYCQCAVDRTAEVFTPAEFDIFGRYGLSRAGMGPAPSDEEMRSSDTLEFASRVATLHEIVHNTCNAILFGPEK